MTPLDSKLCLLVLVVVGFVSGDDTTTHSPFEWMRLVGGTSSMEGQVEVYDYDAGEWGSVCDTSWGTNEATVVCRYFGYLGSVIPKSNGYFVTPIAAENTFVTNLFCDGSEYSLIYCSYTGVWDQNTDCETDTNAAGVVCSVADPDDDVAPIRLAGSSLSSEGRIEIYYNGIWGSICDDNWDDTNAQVACRQLGYDGISQALGDAYFGESTGNILLDDIECVGTEAHLSDCYHGGWYNHDCWHSEDAGVVCSVGVGSYGYCDGDWDCPTVYDTYDEFYCCSNNYCCSRFDDDGVFFDGIAAFAWSIIISILFGVGAVIAGSIVGIVCCVKMLKQRQATQNQPGGHNVPPPPGSYPTQMVPAMVQQPGIPLQHYQQQQSPPPLQPGNMTMYPPPPTYYPPTQAPPLYPTNQTPL